MNSYKNKRDNANMSNELGKCLCVSIPYHELGLIKDLDKLAHYDLCNSRSQYLRRLIRRERNILIEQGEVNFKQVFA